MRTLVFGNIFAIIHNLIVAVFKHNITPEIPTNNLETIEADVELELKKVPYNQERKNISPKRWNAK